MSESRTGLAGREARRVDIICVLVLTVVAVALLVDFRGLPLRSLAARHAAVGVDFCQRHQPFDVQYNHNLYDTKPPFSLWLEAAPMFVLGVTNASMRLTSELFAIALVLIVFWLGRRMFNTGAGFAAGLAAATSMILPWVTRHSLLDTGALFLMTLPMVFFYLGWRDEKNRRRYVFLFYITSAVATWDRGPVGCVLPGLAVAATLIPLGQWRVLGQFLNPLAILVWVAMVAPYYWAMHNGQLGTIILQENLEHFLKGDTPGGQPDTIQPPYYWLVTYLVRYLPWTGFLLLGLVHAARRRHAEERGELWFLTAWLASWFLFWNFAAARNETYLLVLLVPTAIFVGYVLDFLWRDPCSAKPLCRTASLSSGELPADKCKVICASQGEAEPASVADTPAKRAWLIFSMALLALVSIATPIAMLLSVKAEFTISVWVGVTVALACVGIAAVTMVCMRRTRPALVTAAVLATLGTLIVVAGVRPIMDRKSPGEELIREVGRLADGHPLVIYAGKGSKDLLRDDHSIVLYAASPYKVAVAADPATAQKRRDRSAVIFASEGAREELASLKPETQPIRLEDSSGAYLVYLPAK